MNFLILFTFVTLTEAGLLKNVTSEDNSTTVNPQSDATTTVVMPFSAPNNCKLHPKNLTAVLELKDVLYDGLKMIRYIFCPLIVIISF